MHVGRSDFSDPVCKCKPLLPPLQHPWLRMRTFCPCRSKRAVGEGQGRKIRKSRDRTGPSVSRNGRRQEGTRRKAEWAECAFLGRENSSWVVSKDDYRRMARVLAKHLRQTREKYTGKWRNDTLVEFISCFNTKDITRRMWSTCSPHGQFNTEVWMCVKYVVDSLFFSATFSIFITKII